MSNLIDSFANRLKYAITIKDIKPIELSKKTGISKTNISCYMSGKYEAKQDGVKILADALDVNPVWLMGYDVPIERELNNINTIPLSNMQQTEIPVLGLVKAGYDYLANENKIGHIYLDFKPTDPENYYALQVTGDSMEPLFSDGDVAIVHKQDDFENGNTCVVLINGDEATVKKVIKTDDGIDLIAMNPYYPKKHFTKDEMAETPVKVIGRVIQSRSNKVDF